MSGAVSTAEAGRIRDAARIVRASGVIAIVSFVAWFFWEPAYVGVAAWPLALFVLATACIPLIRPMGIAATVLLTLVAIGGLVAAILGVVIPPPDRSVSFSNVYGAGFIAFGAWFVGAGAAFREHGPFDPKVAQQATRGGIGLAFLGASWFVDDLGISLGLLLGGLLFVGGVDRFLKEARTYGLAAESPGSAGAAAAPTDPRDWVSPESSGGSR